MTPNLLLMGRVLALAMLVRGTWTRLPEPFLPFLPGLEPGRGALTVAFVVAALALLAGRWPRTAALTLGATLLVAVLSSRIYYGNNRVFVGTALVLLGLSERERPDRLFRWLLALVYAGAALNKLLDPDWRSGQFLDYWIGTVLHNPLWVPALGLPLCWGTIAGQLWLAVAFLYRPWTRGALRVNLVFQLLLLILTGSTLGEFFFGMTAVTLAFVERPVDGRPWLAVTAGLALLSGWPLRILALAASLPLSRSVLCAGPPSSAESGERSATPGD